jgi:hypothetical protein
MRTLPRLLASTLAAAAIVLVGASSAFAAATPQTASLDANFCFDSGPKHYCYDIEGTVLYLDTTAGSTATIHQITRTTVSEDGVVTGEAMSVQTMRGVFQADGTVVTNTVINTRSSLSGDECSYRLVLRMIDYEAVVYQVYLGCL